MYGKQFLSVQAVKTGRLPCGSADQSRPSSGKVESSRDKSVSEKGLFNSLGSFPYTGGLGNLRHFAGFSLACLARIA